MKKAILAILVMAGTLCGCRTPETTVVPVVMQPQQSSFSGKTYIWENWLYSTNRVDR